MAPRTLTVWCADWPVADLDPEIPAAVLRANRVIARTRAAAEGGVSNGDRRRVAQQRCPQLIIVDHDPDRDARRFEPILRAVAEMAPRLEAVEPGWLCLAARGPARYFGGEGAVAERIVGLVRAEIAAGREREVDRPGASSPGAGTHVASAGNLPHAVSDAVSGVGVGVADGRSVSAIAARLAARRPAAHLIVDPNGSPEFLAPLPIGWLQHLGEVSAELIELFARLGVRRCGDLAQLPTGDVVARFGAEGLHAHRLASAADDRPLLSVSPKPDRRCEEEFDGPINQLETVAFLAKRLADQLTDALMREGRTCTRLVVTAESENGERSERVWYREQGMTASAIVERVRWQLEGWSPTAGVVRLGLTPDLIRADDGVQAGIWGGRSANDDDAERTIIRLSGLVGERAVLVPEWVGGRLPAERYRWTPAVSADLHDPTGRLDRGDGSWPGATTAPAPMVVWREPSPVTVTDERGDLVQVSGRGIISAAPAMIEIAGSRSRVVSWAGPWPVEQQWWDARRARRMARVQIVTEDGAAFLVAVEQQAWCLLGSYR